MRISLIAGPLCLALTLILPPPGGLAPEAWIVAGLAGLMALWWLTEAVPLAATAFLPLALAPLLGVGDLEVLAGAYANPLIVLFLGGFIIARAIEVWGLHRRIAAALLQLAGTAPRRVLAAVMVATAFLSLWISNTAAAMVMAPIAAGLAADPGRAGVARALLLGVAFAATIGGMGSLIGTPPNAIFAAYMREAHAIDIGFAQWAMVGLPVATILLACAWAVLGFLSPGLGVTPLEPERAADAGPMSFGARRVAVIAGLTALAWITRPLLQTLLPGLAITDAGIAMLAALALFLVPSGAGGALLDWDGAAALRWDVLILVGGGLALAGLLDSSGLAAWIGGQSTALATLPVPLVILGIAVIIVYVGELASNTATAAIFLPIAGAAAVALGIDPVTFVLPVALAASVGFMLPVATPPNAIAYSYEAVRRADMLKAGALLNVLGILVSVALGSAIGRLVF